MNVRPAAPGDAAGIAALLGQLGYPAARAAGCEQLHVTSAERRTDAHEAYRALGFADTGRRFGKTL